MKMPCLKSERLVLRSMTEEDAAQLIKYSGDYEVSKNLARVPFPYPGDAAANWIEQQHKGIAGINMAITKDNTLIGVIGVVPSSERDLDAFVPVIGYWLARPFWGKGFMQEAVRRFLDWYMPHEPTETMRAAAFEDNPRSLELLSKLGFREVGRGEGFSLARGKKVPDVILELTAERYLRSA